jgi:hypothetical protein
VTEPPPPAKPPGASRYTWFLGVVGFLLIALVTVNSLTTGGVTPGGPDEGGKLAPFAVPIASSSLEGDANVATEDGQGDLGNIAACKYRRADVLNVCQLAERGPVVLAIFPSEAERCRVVLEQFERVARKVPDVQFAAVGARGKRDDLAGDWSFPVGYDRDGAVAGVYGLVGCPQITFAEKGGKVQRTTRRELPDSEIARMARNLG